MGLLLGERSCTLVQRKSTLVRLEWVRYLLSFLFVYFVIDMLAYCLLCTKQACLLLITEDDILVIESLRGPTALTMISKLKCSQCIAYHIHLRIEKGDEFLMTSETLKVLATQKAIVIIISLSRNKNLYKITGQATLIKLPKTTFFRTNHLMVQEANILYIYSQTITYPSFNASLYHSVHTNCTQAH